MRLQHRDGSDSRGMLAEGWLKFSIPEFLLRFSLHTDGVFIQEENKAAQLEEVPEQAKRTNRSLGGSLKAQQPCNQPHLNTAWSVYLDVDTSNYRGFAVTTDAVNKHQMRTAETRSRLLKAAEEVFIREGYEAAQLDEIAKRAKRSKGSVYGIFESKEDLFLELVEHRLRSYMDKLGTLLRETTNVKSRTEVLRASYVTASTDLNWPLLLLEFKLFAVRHKRSKTRLKRVLDVFREFETHYPLEQAFGFRRFPSSIFSARVDVLGSVVSAISLAAMMNPEVLSPEIRQEILGSFFDAITKQQPAPRKSRAITRRSGVRESGDSGFGSSRSRRMTSSISSKTAAYILRPDGG